MRMVAVYASVESVLQQTGAAPDGNRPGIQDSTSCRCIRRRPECCLEGFEKSLAADLQAARGFLDSIYMRCATIRSATARQRCRTCSTLTSPCHLFQAAVSAVPALSAGR